MISGIIYCGACSLYIRGGRTAGGISLEGPPAYQPMTMHLTVFGK